MAGTCRNGVPTFIYVRERVPARAQIASAFKRSGEIPQFPSDLRVRNIKFPKKVLESTLHHNISNT